MTHVLSMPVTSHQSNCGLALSDVQSTRRQSGGRHFAPTMIFHPIPHPNRKKYPRRRKEKSLCEIKFRKRNVSDLQSRRLAKKKNKTKSAALTVFLCFSRTIFTRWYYKYTIVIEKHREDCATHTRNFSLTLTRASWQKVGQGTGGKTGHCWTDVEALIKCWDK